MAGHIVRILILLILLASCGGSGSVAKDSAQQIQKVSDPELQALLDQLQKNRTADAYVKVAQYYAKNKETSKAFSNYQQALKLDSTRWDIRMEYGGYAYYNENKRAGLTEFKLILFGNDATKYTEEIASYLFEYKTTQVTFGPHNSAFPTWASDGSALYFQSDVEGNWDIYKYSFADAVATPFIQTPANDEHPSVSRNGRYLAYTTDMYDDRVIFDEQKWREIVVFDIKNNIHDRTTRNYLDDYYPRFQRHSDELTYITEEVDAKKVKYGERFTYLYTMNPDGSFQIPAGEIGNYYQNSGMKTKSGPNSETLFFSSSMGAKPNFKLFTYSTTEKKAVLLYDNGSNLISVDVSPNGDKILFTTDQYGSLDVVMSDKYLSRIERITSFANDEDQAIFSPDGSKIAFHSNKGGQYDLFVVDLTSRTIEPTVGNLLDKINSEL
jgi:Tol biopolymer transport system component